MCDPLTIASLVLTAGSVAANSAAQSQVAGARAQAMNAERERQTRLDQQAAGVNAQAQDQYADFKGQQAQQEQKLSDLFKGQTIAPPPPSAALPQSSSNLVVNEEGKQKGLADAFAQKTGDALANLRAFSQALGADSRSTARSAGDLGQIDSFKAGSSAVLPYELDAASNAGNGLKTVGDVLGGLGMVTGLAGLTAPAKLATTALPQQTLSIAAKAPTIAPGALSSAVPRLGAFF